MLIRGVLILSWFWHGQRSLTDVIGSSMLWCLWVRAVSWVEGGVGRGVTSWHVVALCTDVDCGCVVGSRSGVLLD